MSLRTIDLFAGVGGLTVGLRKARDIEGPLFDVRLLVDIDEEMAQIFRMNDKTRKYLVADLMKTSPNDLLRAAQLRKGQLDVLVGGPPCQGFSSVGKRAIDDPKNGLVKRFLKIATELKPKLVLMENVPAVINWNDGQLYKEVDVALRKAGYESRWNVLSAADFGVPQLRRRAFLVATRSDIELGGIGFPRTQGSSVQKARHTIPEEEWFQLRSAAAGYITVEEAIGDLPPLKAGESIGNYSREPFTDYQKARRGSSNFLFNHEARGHTSEFLDNKIKKIQPGKSNKDLPRSQRFEREEKEDYYSQAYGRLHPRMIAQTITTNFLNPGSGRFTHYRDHRSITVREAARLQSFDDSFLFYGDYGVQQRAVGNAVPPLMARALGEHFGSALANQIGRRQEVVQR